jgi:hypothetical protein
LGRLREYGVAGAETVLLGLAAAEGERGPMLELLAHDVRPGLV